MDRRMSMRRHAAVVLLVLLAAAQPANVHGTGCENTTVCATSEPPAARASLPARLARSGSDQPPVLLRMCTSTAHKLIGDTCTQFLRTCICYCHGGPAWSRAGPDSEAPAQNRPPHVPCCWDGAVWQHRLQRPESPL
jgi:hypothetical protein